jgi:hypothetical protein
MDSTDPDPQNCPVPPFSVLMRQKTGTRRRWARSAANPTSIRIKSKLTYLLFDPFAHELDDGPHNEERIACLQRIKTMATQQ